jgi:hypothetical protein
MGLKEGESNMKQNVIPILHRPMADLFVALLLKGSYALS